MKCSKQLGAVRFQVHLTVTQSRLGIVPESIALCQGHIVGLAHALSVTNQVRSLVK